MASKIVKRAAWHARAPHGTGNAISAHPFGVAVHYADANVGTHSHDLCAPRVQAIQRFHMDVRGWSDIAYTLLVCVHGQVYEGRGTGRGSAANGTTKANADYYAVCALIGPDDKPTPELLTGIGEAIAACRKAGAGARVLGHRDLVPTACPGDALYALVKAGHWNASATPPKPLTIPQTTVKPLEDTTMKPWFFRAQSGAIVIVTPTGVRGLNPAAWKAWQSFGYTLAPKMDALSPADFATALTSLGGLVK